MPIHNIVNCKGFAEATTGWVASAECMKARLGFVILFFLLAIIRKWGGEEIGIEFNSIFAYLFGLIAYFLIITFTGNFLLSFVIGLGAGLIGGYCSRFLGLGIGGEEW